jgi:hypothetical protein
LAALSINGPYLFSRSIHQQLPPDLARKLAYENTQRIYRLGQ